MTTPVLTEKQGKLVEAILGHAELLNELLGEAAEVDLLVGLETGTTPISSRRARAYFHVRIFQYVDAYITEAGNPDEGAGDA